MILSLDQLDAISEVVNIGVGRAAASLSDLIGTRIELKVPVVRVMGEAEIQDAGMAILQAFDGDVSGKAILSFPSHSGEQLAKLLAGYGEDQELPAIELSGILSEVGNIVLNGVLGSLSNMIDSDLKYSVPDFFVDKTLDKLVRSDCFEVDSTDTLLIADTHFCVKSKNIFGSVVLGFEIGSLECLVAQLVEA